MNNWLSSLFKFNKERDYISSRLEAWILQWFSIIDCLIFIISFTYIESFFMETYWDYLWDKYYLEGKENENTF